MKELAYRPNTGRCALGFSARAFGVAWLAMALACGSPGNEPGNQQRAEDPRPDASLHKVQLSAEKAAPLEARGAKVLGDYGSFKLLQVDDATLASLPPEDVEPRDDYDHILLNTGVIDTTSPHARSLRGMRQTAAGKRFHLVHFSGPVRPEGYKALEATGVKVVTYIPHNAYLVYGDPAAMNNLRRHTAAASAIQWDGEYPDDYKLHPSVNEVTAPAYSIQLVKDDETNGQTLALIRKLQSREALVQEVLDYVNVVAWVDRQALHELVRRPDVLSIQPRLEPKLLDERQGMILAGQHSGTEPSGPGYLAWLTSKGFTQEQFTASGFGVDVSDSALDNGTTTPNHFGLYVAGSVTGTSRVVYNRVEGSPSPDSVITGCDGHGTLDAHIVAGYVHQSGAPHTDAAGYRYGLGVAPFVKVGSSVVFDPYFTSPSYADLQARAYRDGMRISTNSWGFSRGMYNTDAQAYDALVRDAQPSGSAVPNPGNQEMSIIFSAGNAGPTAGTVGSPGTAKNVITVGASENVQPFGGEDRCHTGDLEADSLHDVGDFSSRGPTADGRKKPDIMAPGTHISGGVAQVEGQRETPPAFPLGQALSCFDPIVCGGSNGVFHPADQQWYTASSGTSHSAPAVAGGAALLRQYFINQGLPPPSPAMTKAYLMSSARYMTGRGANDSLFSNNQGTGLMDLGMAFDGLPRLLDDQHPESLFTASGQTRTFSGIIEDSSKPLRVTLAWTDAPGSTTGSAWRNNLDLTVTVDGILYKGNFFSGAHSITGGTADGANNVESVFLPAGLSGAYTVRVTATNINSNGVPDNDTPLDQDFALVVYNSCNTAAPTPSGLSASVSGDNVIDLDWVPNGAASYNIYRSTTPGGAYTRIASVEAPPYQDKSVSGDTTYSYVVRALECIESPPSSEVSATATGVCALPPTFAGITSAAEGFTRTCSNTLSWSAATPACGGRLSYSVYRSTTQGFTASAANRIATGVTGTSFADDLNLSGGTTYYYVVRATEESASGKVEETNPVERAASPAGPITPGARFFDDFDSRRPENASAYWLPTATAGTTASMNIVSGCHYQSATRAYRLGATDTNCGGTYLPSQRLLLVLGGDGSVSPDINGFAIPAGASKPRMTFNRWHDFETRFDGVWLVYSTTGAGGPWRAVSDQVSSREPYISEGGYYDTLLSYPDRIRIWTHRSAAENSALNRVTVELDSLAGQTVWFGFRFYSDGFGEAQEGFYVDDVRITADEVSSCTPRLPPPGPAVAYRVTGLPSAARVNQPVTFSVSAIDAVGVVATGYQGRASFRSSDGQAVLPSPTSFTQGVASGLSATFSTSGMQSIVATDMASPGITGSARTQVTSAAKLVFSSQPTDTLAGASFSPAPEVSVVDEEGKVVTSGSFNISVSLENNAGGGTLSGTTSVNTLYGVATFDHLSIGKRGTGYTLRASASGFEEITSSAFTITPAEASRLAFTAQPSTTVAGAPIHPAVRVSVQDAFGNPTLFTGKVTLWVSAGPSGSTLSGATTVESESGVATFPDLSIDKAGKGYKLVADSGTFIAASSDAFEITPGTPRRATITRQPSNVRAGTAIDPAVQVSLYDEYGNLATRSTDAVTVSLGNNPGGATLGGITTVNAVAGVATFDSLTVSRPGSPYTLKAGPSGVDPDTSDGFDVSEGEPTRLVFTHPPADPAAGSPFSVRVEVRDGAGNIVSGSNARVSLSLGANPANGTLRGPASASAIQGVATFEGLSLHEAGTGYTLVATTEGFTGATSEEFDVTPGAAASYSLELPANSPAGQEVTLSARAHDAYGNVDTAYSGTARVTSSDTEAVLPASVSFHQGVGTDVKVTFKSPGLETLTLEDNERASLSGIARTHVTASEEPSGCGCGATSGTNASLYLGLLALARYVAVRRRWTKRAA